MVGEGVGMDQLTLEVDDTINLVNGTNHSLLSNHACCNFLCLHKRIREHIVANQFAEVLCDGWGHGMVP